MIEIDGSQGEGGGQILRSALSLALLTGQAFTLRNIRAGRKKPGLQPQHLASVKAATAVGSAEVSGASLGSGELRFVPGPVTAGNYHFAIGTAGATGLVLHTVYLPLALRGQTVSRVTITGGTHVITSPAYPFLQRSWVPAITQMGLGLTLTLERHGFYPRGGGQLIAAIAPTARVRGLSLLERPPVTRAVGSALAANLPEHIATRLARRLTQRLEQKDIRTHIEIEEATNGPGACVSVSLPEVPIPPAFVTIGERGVPADAVADRTASAVLDYLESAAVVEAHLADQLLLPLACAEEASEYRVEQVTAHLTTNADVIRLFLPRKITITGTVGEPGLVQIAAQNELR
jgi:RNA 3'-terminal phosphate cyclase (ATP)